MATSPRDSFTLAGHPSLANSSFAPHELISNAYKQEIAAVNVADSAAAVVCRAERLKARSKRAGRDFGSVSVGAIHAALMALARRPTARM